MIAHAQIAISDSTPKSKKFPDIIIGRKFNKLTVVASVQNDNGIYNRFQCLCDCGNTTVVRKWDLIGSAAARPIKSCGKCYNHIGRISHGAMLGGKPSTTYRSWMNMKQRCLNPKNRNYSKYGGRGITVWDRWINSFENFLADMGRRPDATSLDRIDNTKGYSPTNCRWATTKEQSRNKRSNRLVECNGQKKTVVEWSEIASINQRTLTKRLNKGWEPQKAIYLPVNYGPNKS